MVYIVINEILESYGQPLQFGPFRTAPSYVLKEVCVNLANHSLLPQTLRSNGGSGTRIGGTFVPYTRTHTRFGGRRRWFGCHACSRPCRVVYRRRNAFACRKCTGLQYRSQYTRGLVRDLDRIDKLRALIARRLGRSFEYGEEFPPKPRAMRWTTYRALAARWDALEG